MIAHIQRLTMLGIVGCATFFLCLLWERSPITAVVAFFAILLAHFMVLALQFAVLPWVNAGDVTPHAHYQQLLLAWFRESFAAAQVFSWWQPFRARRFSDQLVCKYPAQGKRGIVLIHGFLCNRAVWMRWFPVLAHHGVPFIAVNLEPVFGSIDSYIGVLDKAVNAMYAATGQPPLLVCHSMGGLAARAWYQTSSTQEGAFHRIVTIASPHSGTQIGNGLPRVPWMRNVTQMRHGSRWLAELAQKETPAQRSRFTCFYSNCDNIVMPADTAKLDGADNRFVAGVPHVAMALDAGIMRETLAMLDDFPANGLRPTRGADSGRSA